MSAGVVQRIEFAPALFTRELAAYYLSRSVRDIDDLRKTGELIPVGKGKRVFFLKADLDRYVDKLPERDQAVAS
ncbi:helix-turn-helix domain-containing protein [Microbacterium sp. R1]|uniref:DNA-binding protein n=1 Tax=Microbacterium phage vB_MoxS-R1 TaxID=2848881 RepID=A0A8F2IVD2_9CAUD|nr:helix-turn-helix domain-containing protein [Microbacterium sp. R1]YP_010649887.1 DNA-binding protein [Microbacterium phage vB_MoxS-R1]MBE7953584.1 helix-turn-helix domain-containing protein [Microbacterium sp. R1]QWT28857.1 DNA-binding protein [Microbacterium phage vB_MoxS-R1]